SDDQQLGSLHVTPPVVSEKKNLGYLHAKSSDRTRATPAFCILCHADSSEPCMSIARQASSTTAQSKPSLRASSAVHATQKSVARPHTKTRLIPRSSRYPSRPVRLLRSASRKAE